MTSSCAEIHRERSVFVGFLVSQSIWIKITKHLCFQAASGKVATNKKTIKGMDTVSFDLEMVSNCVEAAVPFAGISAGPEGRGSGGTGSSLRAAPGPGVLPARHLKPPRLRARLRPCSASASRE